MRCRRNKFRFRGGSCINTLVSSPRSGLSCHTVAPWVFTNGPGTIRQLTDSGNRFQVKISMYALDSPLSISSFSDFTILRGSVLVITLLARSPSARPVHRVYNLGVHLLLFLLTDTAFNLAKSSISGESAICRFRSTVHRTLASSAD